MLDSSEVQRGVEMVARAMALSAQTAPKARGMDALQIRVVNRDRLPELATAMRRIGEERGIRFFLRDAGNVEKSDACLLVGVQREPTAGLDCGACGFTSCQSMLSQPTMDQTLMRGPACAVRVTDLGIAIGSAVKTASLHNMDNRVMYSIGAAALSLGWLEECTTGFGIPLSAGAKNPFFDRG